MWWRFRKHKLAMVSAVILILLYTMALFADFLAPYSPIHYEGKATYAPPVKLRFVDEEGFHLRPFIYGRKQEIGEFLERTYTEDPTQKYWIRFFVRGDEYKILGLKSNLHLFGLDNGELGLYLLGADRLGRDNLSRIMHGSRISLSIGLVGVFLNMILGVLIGGVSGYYGRLIDTVIQRIIEFIRSIPTIPLWMTLAAALPPTWSNLRVYFGITVILSFVGWTSLARVTRGAFLSLRESDFVMAAKLAGASEFRIIVRHMVPSFASYLIATLTLAVPGMILGETSLSFLGIGLRPPVVSWGVLLKTITNLQVVSQAPWLLTPTIPVVLAVLAFNFVGDGMRDAADPYGQ
jgi:peptide/nickel transport system permease protein